MARKQIVQLVDDLDGRDIEDGGETVAFSFRGASYEIDLSDANIDKLTTALEPYVSAARRTNSRPTSPARASIDRSQLDAMRTWARDHGYEVSSRGRISQKIQDAYHHAR